MINKVQFSSVQTVNKLFFIVLLGAASQRVELLFLEMFGNEFMQDIVKEWKRKERGARPGLAEWGVILYVISKFV